MDSGEEDLLVGDRCLFPVEYRCRSCIVGAIGGKLEMDSQNNGRSGVRCQLPYSLRKTLSWTVLFSIISNKNPVVDDILKQSYCGVFTH